MSKFQEKLKQKILQDCDILIPNTAILKRRNLSWQAATCGRLKWYWFCPQSQNDHLTIIGSCEDMRKLIKCKKIEMLQIAGQTELFTS